MKRALAVRQSDREQIRQRRGRVAAVGQRRAAAQEEQSPAPPVDELPDQFLLRGREIGGLDVAQMIRPW